MKLINVIFPLNICYVIHLFLFCSIINFISTQNIVDNEEKYPSFKSFLYKFDKTYNLKAEYEKRERIYLQNIEQIKQSNCESCGVNFYADWTEQEIKNLRNVKQSEHKSNIAAIPKRNQRILAEGLPPSFDWRSVIGFSEVKDSGSCGASYAFSTVAFFEQQAILSGNANSSINFSEMYLLTCSLQNLGCKGGQIESAFDLVIDKGGLPLESKYPYNPFRIPSTNICLQTDLFKVSNVSRMSYYNIKDPEEIKLLIGKRPVISSICGVDLAFYYPNSTNDSSRTLKCNPINKVIDHSVLIVGYTETEWIVKNSWGKNWGIDGYAYISRSSAHDCCIGDQVHTTGQISWICGVKYCKTCVQTYTCSRCETGRWVFHNSTTGRQTCEVCTQQNCAECYNYVGSCKWCAEGFALNTTTGKCVTSTIANCNKFGGSTCYQCKPGYKTSLSRASCLTYCTVNNCNKCMNGPCTECKIGFSLIKATVNGKNTQYCVLNNCTLGNCSYCDVSGTACLQCKSGYLLNSTTASCYTNCTLTDCVNCTSGSTTCNECVQGKSYNSTKKACEVFAGTTNCKVHGKTTCTTCRAGYTLNSTTKLCVQNCVSCSTCLQNNPNQCVSCPDDSFLRVGTYETVCVPNPCNITNCTACYANGTCMTCATKFLVYNESSNRCQNQCTLPNCRDCLPNATACSYCNHGFAVDYYNKSCVDTTIEHCPLVYTYNNSLQCWSCDTNYYLDFSTYKYCYIFCTDTNCQMCEQTSLFICTKCNKGYYFSEQNGGRTCTKIKPIMTGCELTTYNQSYCYKCNTYYNLNPTTGSCELNTQSCPQICEYCTQNNNSMISCKCKQQGYAFQYSTQTCIPNPITNNPNCTIVEVYSGVFFCLQCENKMIIGADYLTCLPLCSVANCSQCLDGYSTSCSICDPGFYLQSISNCVSCLPNCRACTSVKCLACQPGYQLSSNGLSCTQINCTQGFFFDGISCSCPPGTYLKKQTCNPCSQVNCIQCSSSQCFVCQEGYFIEQNNCKKCSKSCKSCNSSIRCTQCKDDYVLDNDTKLCVNPVEKGASFYVSSTAILSCPSFCINCNNQSICTKCLPGYVVVNGQCFPCKGTCKTCYPSNVSQCLSCFDGYYLEKTTCVKCNLTNCQNCQLDASICIKCKEGFYIKDGECIQCGKQNCLKCNFTGFCTKCSSGYTLMADGTCQQCGGNCRACNSSAINQCFIECNSTSYLSNNTCISCPSECESCISTQICLSCSNGYNLRNGTCIQTCQTGCYQCDQQNPTKCQKCIEGYFLNTNNKCEINLSCNDNRTCTICPLTWAVVNGTCQMCNVSQNCTQCANGNLSRCIKCKSGFFLNNTQCVVCNEGCQNCSEFERCQMCKDGYFLPQNVFVGNCSKCDPMCKTCSDYKDKCLTCNEGYQLTVTDMCLRVQKIDAQIELNLAFDNFPNVSKDIRSQIINLIGSEYRNETKLYIITGLKQGSTILSFTVSIPDSQDPTVIFNKVKTQLTNLRQVAGISLIAVKRIDLINPNANNNRRNIDNNQTLINPVITQPQTGNKSNTTLAIVLGIVIPCVVILLGVVGYFLRKRYFQNRVQNQSEVEFRQVGQQSVIEAKTNTIVFDMSPLKQRKLKDLQNLNYSNKNQAYFNNTTTYPQQSFQRLDLNQTSTKRDYVSQFENNNVQNVVAEPNNQDLQSRRSIDNKMVNSSQSENLNKDIKDSQQLINPDKTDKKISQNQSDELKHPFDHNRFFEIQEQSKPVTPQCLNQAHSIPGPVNPHLKVIDFGGDDQNQQF